MFPTSAAYKALKTLPKLPSPICASRVILSCEMLLPDSKLSVSVESSCALSYKSFSVMQERGKAEGERLRARNSCTFSAWCRSGLRQPLLSLLSRSVQWPRRSRMQMPPAASAKRARPIKTAGKAWPACWFWLVVDGAGEEGGHVWLWPASWSFSLTRGMTSVPSGQ